MQGGERMLDWLEKRQDRRALNFGEKRIKFRRRSGV